MPSFSRPCLVCSSITAKGETYCPKHLAEIKQARELKRSQDPARQMKKKLLYNSDYRKARTAILQHVRLYGATCHLCKKPIGTSEPIDIDHVQPGVITSDLAPTHRYCNRSRGNRAI